LTRTLERENSYGETEGSSTAPVGSRAQAGRRTLFLKAESRRGPEKHGSQGSHPQDCP
jgi:hypothetical protein